jgi:hypothetical protein
MPDFTPNLTGGKRFQLVRTFECEIANAEAVLSTLQEAYQISPVELVGYLCTEAMANERRVYVYMYDASSAKDGVVEAPEFMLGTEDDYDEENRVYGPITWAWTDGGDQLKEEEKDPLPGFTAFEKVYLR